MAAFNRFLLYVDVFLFVVAADVLFPHKGKFVLCTTSVYVIKKEGRKKLKQKQTHKEDTWTSVIKPWGLVESLCETHLCQRLLINE